MAKINAATIRRTLSDAVTDVRVHWKKPARGKYVSYKEMLAFSIGGFGKELVGNLFSYFGLAAGNTLLAMLIGIRPTHIFYMSTAMTIINVLASIIRAKIVDNTRTRMGKFRPYILFAGFPIVAWCIAFLFLPFKTMTYSQNLIVVFVFVLVQSFGSAFYNDTFNDLRSVMSPDSNERARIFSITSIMTSVAPTITGILIPFLVDKIPDGYLNIDTYKWVIAPLAIIGILMAPVTALGTKERIITSKAYKPKVRVFKEIIQICKNKYWWIRNISG
ncbi:MAG: MFS transporter, partial [Clostridiales bacterium]|nr:MFS transporter [Clostridiales bacterium]